jgi:hypothetical protein
MKCPNCGAELNNYHCEYCDSDFAEFKHTSEHAPHVVINNYFDSDAADNAKERASENVYEHTVYVNYEYVSSKSRTLTLLLAFFLGCLGVHRFYTGRIGLGIAELFTCGLFGIGWIVDIILALTGCMKDGQGLPIKTW